MNFNIADADLIYLFVSSANLAAGDFSRIKAGFISKLSPTSLF
jgi:hypothetical protein